MTGMVRLSLLRKHSFTLARSLLGPRCAIRGCFITKPVREPPISSNHSGTSDGGTDHGGLSPTLDSERCFVVYSCIISPRVDRSGEEQEQREESRARHCVAWFNRSVDAVPERSASVLFPLH